MNNQYRTGAASLFAALARGDEQPEATPPAQEVTVTCWYCLSDHTELVDHVHDMYRCLDCGEVFVRAAPSG